MRYTKITSIIGSQLIIEKHCYNEIVSVFETCPGIKNPYTSHKSNHFFLSWIILRKFNVWNLLTSAINIIIIIITIVLHCFCYFSPIKNCLGRRKWHWYLLILIGWVTQRSLLQFFGLFDIESHHLFDFIIFSKAS